MRCYARRQDLNRLRKVYRTLTAAPRREIDDDGAEPSPETEALLHALLARPERA